MHAGFGITNIGVLRKRWRFGLEIPLLIRRSLYIQKLALYDLLFLLNGSDMIWSEGSFYDRRQGGGFVTKI